jgi:hypothetical protein
LLCFIFISYVVWIVWVLNYFTVEHFILLSFCNCLLTCQFFIVFFFFKFIIWYLVIKPLSSLFVTLFLLLIYLSLISQVNRLVKLTMIASYLFFLVFFLWNLLVLQFHTLALNYWPLSYVIFSLFYFIFYVRLTRVRVS